MESVLTRPHLNENIDFNNSEQKSGIKVYVLYPKQSITEENIADFWHTLRLKRVLTMFLEKASALYDARFNNKQHWVLEAIVSEMSIQATGDQHLQIKTAYLRLDRIIGVYFPEKNNFFQKNPYYNA